MNKLYGIVFFLLVADYATAILRPYVYEFGENTGVLINSYEGTIPILKPVNNIGLIIPPGVTVTYVRVTVNAVSSPKVDYDADSQRVTIAYDFTQVTYSTYSIIVKGYYSKS